MGESPTAPALPRRSSLTRRCGTSTSCMYLARRLIVDARGDESTDRITANQPLTLAQARVLIASRALWCRPPEGVAIHAICSFIHPPSRNEAYPHQHNGGRRGEHAPRRMKHLKRLRRPCFVAAEHANYGNYTRAAFATRSVFVPAVSIAHRCRRLLLYESAIGRHGSSEQIELPCAGQWRRQMTTWVTVFTGLPAGGGGRGRDSLTTATHR
uniref:Uncharacterized protein n=1 Tax=Plectus sambesii TaxID=2011161 RepID=A0A914WXH6_9BILA